MRKLVICDDGELDRSLLQTILQNCLNELGAAIEIVAYASGLALVEDVKEDELDIGLLFLDIEMEDMNGIETAKQLRALNCRAPIVFLTSSKEYAFESYDVKAAGYLLKPFDPDRLKQIIQHTIRTELPKRLAIRSDRKYRYLYLDEILYIESDKHTVTVHMKDGTVVNATEKLNDIEKRIHNRKFLRCHQSYLVNMAYVSDVKDGFIMSDGSKVPMRVRGRKEITDQYFAYFTETDQKPLDEEI